MTEVTYTLAFAAGVLSFLSPCVLPLIPSYITYITGMSFEDVTERSGESRVRKLTALHSLVFILGFSTIFIVLGASSSYVGQLFRQYQDGIRVAGGILVILLGIFITGLIRPGFLMKDRKLHIQNRPAGYVGTYLIGITFAAGWTPCIGPILGGILIYTGTQGSATLGFKLLGVYSLGLGIPFFLSAIAINSFLSYTKLAYRFMRPIMITSGIVLIVFGILLLADKVSDLASYFPDFGLDL